MSGNLSEWVWDEYDYYDSSNQTDPLGPEDIGSQRFPTIRGGSYGYQLSDLRSAGRGFEGPDNRKWYLGMRPARTVTSLFIP